MPLVRSASAGLAAVMFLQLSLQAQPAKSLQSFFDEFTAEWMRAHPQLATSVRYFKGGEQERLDRQLGPVWTDAFAQLEVGLARKGLRELARFNGSQMTETERVSADLMKWQLEHEVESQRFRDYTFPLEQMRGANVRLVDHLTVTRPVASEKDAIHYLAALRDIRPRMDEATARAKQLAAKNIVPPKFILQATIKQMWNFADGAPSDNVLVSVFVQKLKSIPDLSPARRAELSAQAEKIVASEVYPAWKQAIGVLESQLSRANDDAGLWRLKGGAEAYAYFLRFFTTTSLSADEIHQIGLREVAAIEKEMDVLLRSIGRTEGSVNQRIGTLIVDMGYPKTDEGGKTLMADLEVYIRDAEKRSASLFKTTPKAAVIAQPYPKFKEANAAASYTPPPQDGSRPGIFQMPLRHERLTRFSLKSLAYHETVPGHHFQVALQLENKDLPRFRQIRAFGFISASGEGWGLYAERLAAESGWYEGDVEGRLGQLNSALFRARRLVVDTGLHAKRWTRQQAIDYGIGASEVERYVVLPGQACSYMLGLLKLVELRDRARTELGSKFSLPEFHDVVLQTGTVPFDVLEKQVDAYVSKNR